jgi:murein DD-endopeptidase MepM/ murein hydrolase activator NlpD
MESAQSLKAGFMTRFQAYLVHPHTRIYADRRFLFLGTAAALAIGVIALRPDGINAQAEEALVEVSAPTHDLSRDDLYLAERMDQRLATKEVTLKPGDNLGPLLQRNGVTPGTAYELTQAFGEVFSPTKLRAGQSFLISYDGEDVTSLAFKPDVARTVFVERDGESFEAREVAAEFKYDTLTVRGTVNNSLYVDAKRLGAPDRVIQQFASIYEYSVDFQRDIRKGDEFEMFFEAAMDRDGNIIKSQDLMFTSFSPRGKTGEYYLYADSNGDENYYDETGKTAKRKLRATPVNGARLSSGFGRRRHPVLGYAKMHRGLDFAAPRGTPIYAAGAGTVERANRYGSFGNYIRIRHSGGYQTAYAHLKGFGKGIRKGARVRQDQVIGYVGTTGRSTGPHLHYEVHHNGKAINPRTLAQLPGKPLAKSEMSGFAQRRAEIDAMRERSDVREPVVVEQVAETVALD